MDSATAVTVDSSNNLFVTGTSRLIHEWIENADFATVKYSSAGVPVWTNRYDGPGKGSDEAIGLAVDASGNVFVTGASVGANGDPAHATIKYSFEGVPMWTNRNTSGYPKAIAVDHTGNAVVTGEAHAGGGNPDYTTAKYSSAGTTLWTKRYNGPANLSDFATHVAVDRDDNVVVTGYSVGIGSSYDCATIKYSGTGTPLWTNRYHGGHGDDMPQAMASDKGGNVVIAGSSWSGSSWDYVAICYSNSGAPLWTNRYDGPGKGHDGATAITIKTNGDVLVTGYSWRGSQTDGAYDYATIAYSSIGIPLWTNRHDVIASGLNSDHTRSMSLDLNGNIFVTGASWNGSNVDCVTVKYSNSSLPPLSIGRGPNKAVAVSWPSPSSGFVLQQDTNGFGPTNWRNVLTPPSDNGTTRTVVLNLPSERAFFRLIRQ